ncbi:GNAT family N-acetyltransferase [Virgibacillus kekensis]|uniref:GNAT family N-acetyltransferase n=1 Tax=Virgibacillus kekensis TaxID=202261 RepID=A0ABV9DI21_9BACI
MFIIEIDNEIALKPLDIKDAGFLFELTDSSRDVLRQWLPWVDGTKTIEDSKTFIRLAEKSLIEKRGLTTGIFYENNLAGVIGFNNFDWSNEIGYIGYWLGTDFQGKGIMTRAVNGLIDYAFHSLGLNRIEIRAAYGNRRSRAIPERLGFQIEGQIRQAEWLYDHYVDHVVYGMLASEWKFRRDI